MAPSIRVLLALLWLGWGTTAAADLPIEPGQSRDQVVEILGHPWQVSDEVWTYAECDWRIRRMTIPAATWRLQYRQSRELHIRKHGPRHTRIPFAPPPRYREERGCRRYVALYVEFRENRVEAVRVPGERTWLESHWH